MYCQNCGKFIGNDATLCDECREKSGAAETVTQNATQAPNPANQFTYTPESAVSLGKAIAAMVLSNVGFLLIYIGIFVLVGLLASESDLGGMPVLFFFGFIVTLLGLIFGIQSINHFKATSMVKTGKRIPLLILGIISVVLASLGLFIGAILLIALL